MFNKVTVFTVIALTILFGLTFNEVSKLGKKIKLSNQVAYAQWLTRLEATFKSPEECQLRSQSICNYEECDVPAGKTIREVCGSDYVNGWKPTTVIIPEFYLNLKNIRLGIATPSARSLIDINKDLKSISYTSTKTSAAAPDQSQKITDTEWTLLVNKMVLYEFTKLNRQLTATSTPGVTNYTITLIARTAGDDQQTQGQTEESTISCPAPSCPRDFIDVKNNLIRLWDGTVLE